MQFQEMIMAFCQAVSLLKAGLKYIAWDNLMIEYGGLFWCKKKNVVKFR